MSMPKEKIEGLDEEHFAFLFNERAAIMEYDGLLERNEAEKQAHREAMAEFKRVFPKLSSRSAEQLLEYFKTVPGK